MYQVSHVQRSKGCSRVADPDILKGNASRGLQDTLRAVKRVQLRISFWIQDALTKCFES